MGDTSGAVLRARTTNSARISRGANNAIRSLLAGKLPVLIVDELLRITHYNATVAGLFNPLDSGVRFLRDLELDSRFQEKVSEALRNQEPSAILLRAGRLTLNTAITPYLEGFDRRALILFHDLTAAVRAADRWKRAGARLRRDAAYRSAAFDCLPAPIAIVDSDGFILAANRSWMERARHAPPAGTASQEVGSNYLAYCAALEGDCATAGGTAADGIRNVLQGERDAFSSRYACHRGEETRCSIWWSTRSDEQWAGAGRC